MTSATTGAAVAEGVEPRALGGGRLGKDAVYAITAGVFLVVLAIANNGARDSQAWATTVFWVGLLGLFVPAAVFLTASQASPRQRLHIVVVLGMSLYVAKVLHSPAGFTFHDELVTYRSTEDLTSAGRLFSPNPIVAAFDNFPALELCTGAMQDLTGLSQFWSGIVVVGACKFALLVGLFAVMLTASGSARLAGVAALVYAANPNFVFFDAQYSYESFALALAILLIGLLARRQADASRGLVAAMLVIAAAVVAGHHLTSYALTLLLVAWLAATGFGRLKSTRHRTTVAVVAFATGLGVLAWYLAAASTTSSYLGPVVTNALSASYDVLTGQSQGKAPFQNVGAPPVPTLERVVGFTTVGLLLALLPVGLWRMRGALRTHALAVVLALLAAAYPFSLALRLTNAGTESSNRASEFVYLGLGLVAAFALEARRTGSARSHALLRVGAVAALSIVFCGGIVIGWAPSSRLPGSFLVVADPRSVDAPGLAAARWARGALPAHSVVVADRSNALLFSAYGRLNPVVGNVGGHSVDGVITSPEFGPDQQAAVKLDRIRYVVTDSRLPTSRPLIGYYVDRDSEALAFKYRRPLPESAVSKFADDPSVLPVYSNGTVAVYDTAPLLGVIPGTEGRR